MSESPETDGFNGGENADRKRKEEQRISWEEESRRDREIQALESQLKADKEERDALLKRADTWYRSSILRGYIAAVRRALVSNYGQIEEDSEASRWLNCTTRHAAALDPLTPPLRLRPDEDQLRLIPSRTNERMSLSLNDGRHRLGP